MPARPEVTLPIGPLLAATRETLPQFQAEQIGIRPTAFARYIRDGCVRLTSAERFANALGKHPFEVWGAAYWDACETQDEWDEQFRQAQKARHLAAQKRYLANR